MLKANYWLNRAAVLAVGALILTGCGGGATSSGGVDPNEVAATVNGKPIKMEAVERLLKQRAQGQESSLSPLELAAARLEILNSLIEQEVMFQRAEKEGHVPSEDEVNSEFNKRKTDSGLSQEEFEKQMKEAGETEVSFKDTIKRGIAVQKLTEKVAAKVAPPSESEIVAFYNVNKDNFKNRRGAQLAAIVIDPTNSGEGDTTRTEVEGAQKAREVGQRVLSGADFATVARESSEEPNTRMSGGDWRYFTEQEMQQAFGPQIADFVMTKMQAGGIIPQAIPFEGKFLIVKLQRKQEKDEDRTLESPGVRQEIQQGLVEARKRLLGASFLAMALNEAKIENLLAKKVIANPNELSGARPAAPATPPPAASPAAEPAQATASPAASPAESEKKK